ncbi:MAG: phosphatidate cytidylyltransferase [Flavitalea sp.]
MALNIQTFKTRALTALVFVLVMLAGLLWSQGSFFILFSIIHFGCWFEYQKLMERIDPDYKQISGFHKYGIMIAGWCFLMYFTNDDFRFLGLRMHALGFWMGLILLFILPIIELLFSKELTLKNIGKSALGILYISLSWGFMMDMRTQQWSSGISGYTIPLVLISTIWINDTMQYLVGSFFGKTPFSAISPKKTWEGTIGGIILAVVIVTISMYYIDNGNATLYWFGIALIGSVIGTAGDLLESKLKRMADVKDSGHFMPGHGGFLDRFDSLILATPFAWLLTVLTQ